MNNITNTMNNATLCSSNNLVFSNNNNFDCQGTVRSGYISVGNSVKTHVQEDTNEKTVHKYLLPIADDVEIKSTLTLNRSKDNPTLRVWIQDEDIKKNEFINDFDITLYIDQDTYVVDKTSVGFSDNVLTIVLLKREEFVAKSIPVLRN